MSNPPFEVALGDTVRREVERVLERHVGDLHKQQMIAAIVAKPFLTLPDDLMTLANCSRSRAFEIIEDPKFPPTRKHGRQRMARTGPVIDYLVPPLTSDDATGDAA